MIKARLIHPDWGTETDIENVKHIDENWHEVFDFEIGQSCSSFRLMNRNGAYNTIQFEFEKNGVPFDPMKDERYNPYIRRRTNG